MCAVANWQEAFALVGAPHLHLRAMQQVKIKDMGWLAQLKQHKVGAVHQVVARNLSDGTQASLQPLGAGAHLDVANDASGIARTCSGLVVAHRDVL